MLLKLRLNWYFDQYDDVIKWKHFPRYWSYVQGIHRSPVNSPHKGQWHGALMFSLICACINGWVNNREAGDLRRHRAHYDVIVMNLLTSISSNRQGLLSSEANSFHLGVYFRCSINVLYEWSRHLEIYANMRADHQGEELSDPYDSGTGHSSQTFSRLGVICVTTDAKYYVMFETSSYISPVINVIPLCILLKNMGSNFDAHDMPFSSFIMYSLANILRYEWPEGLKYMSSDTATG